MKSDDIVRAGIQVMKKLLGPDGVTAAFRRKHWSSGILKTGRYSCRHFPTESRGSILTLLRSGERS